MQSYTDSIIHGIEKAFKHIINNNRYKSGLNR